jgi:predicted transposase/invertase (TIGR01784 family)
MEILMDNTKYMSPFADAAFKRFFGQEENKSILIDFLNSLLAGERYITDVRYMDKEQVPTEDEMRGSIYDIYCDTDSGEKIIVEMQRCNHPNFAKRMVYYSSKAISKQGDKGDEWRYDVKAVYCIALMGFTESSLERKVVTHVGLCDWDNGKHFVDTLRFVFIQLPLFSKREEECVSLVDKWLYVLKNMDMLDRLPKEFQCEAFRKLKEVSDLSKLTKEERYAYERSLRHYRDALNVYEGAIETGEARGIEKGRAEGKLDVAKSLKKLGVSLDVISESTGIPVQELETF